MMTMKTRPRRDCRQRHPGRTEGSPRIVAAWRVSGPSTCPSHRQRPHLPASMTRSLSLRGVEYRGPHRSW